MSDYEYYECWAIDRPLTDRQINELRAIATGADITRTRFVSEYAFGGIRAELHDLMAHYFDGMVHVTNGGTRRFMLRLPTARVDRAALEACCSGDSASAHVLGEAVVLDFCSETGQLEDWHDGEGWMETLAPLREDLLRGDMRAPYLGWLLCVEREEIEDEAPEPPMPAALGTLSAPLVRLVEFLRIDEDVLAVAAAASAAHARIAASIAALSDREKDDILLAVAKGNGAESNARLLRCLQSSPAERTARVLPEDCGVRTAGKMRAAARRRAEQRERDRAQRAREARAHRAAEQAAARAKHLDGLADRKETAWREAEDLIASKQSMAYDLAAVLLADLCAVAVRTSTVPQFEARLAALRERHHKNPSLLDRLSEIAPPASTQTSALPDAYPPPRAPGRA